MDRRQATQNYFVPGWLNELLDGNVTHPNGAVRDAVASDESQTSLKSSSLNDRKFGGFERHSVSASREERRGSSSMLDAGRKEKNLDHVKNGSDNLSLDDEFPSLNGEVAGENCSVSSSKVTSVWDGSRECGPVSRTSGSGSDSISRVPVLQLQAVVPRRINPVKPAVDQSVPASFKGTGGFGSGGRKMTVLGNGIGNNRQKEHTPMKSVAKVVTRELENRKGNYMKLVRHESLEMSSDSSRSDSCCGSNTGPASNNEHKQALKSWAAVVQNSADTEESSENVIDMLRCDSCTSPGGSTSSVFDNPPETMDFNLEDERRLLYDMGWNENDQCDELTLEEVNKFLISYPDFSKKWELVIDNDGSENGIVRFILQKRQPPR